MVEREKDAREATARLVQTYRTEVDLRRPAISVRGAQCKIEASAAAAGRGGF
jgi:hypothetical protein